MLKTEPLDYHNHLPPYRSLLNPNAQYDYQTHSLVPLSQNDLNVLRTSFQTPTKESGSASNGGGFKMKYKSLLSDVGRSISLKMSNPNLMTSVASVVGSSGKAVVLAKKVQQQAAVSTSKTQQQPRQPLQLKDLPIEVLDYIFSLVDSKTDYKSCMYTNKMFYQLAKSFYYQDLAFVSTYRFAQFISYLRLNSSVGQYVKSVDLSGIKPGYEEDTQEGEDDVNMNDAPAGNREGIERIHDAPAREASPERTDLEFSGKNEPTPKIMAGWRDWKFKSNPLYSVHPSPPKLTKTASNVSIASAKSTKSSLSTKRLSKPFKLFRSKKRRRSITTTNTTSTPRKTPKIEFLDLRAQDQAHSNTLARNASPHPLINKFLMNYSTSKDIPIGYVLHLIRLCPNVERLNLGNLSLSIDYEISRSVVHKYQNFDLMNNYPKDIIKRIDGIMQGNGDVRDDVFSFDRENTDIYSRFPSLFKSNQAPPTSCASSVYSITTFSKPINIKYNSLLPPLPSTVSDISYINKGDGKVYLSDLNLKSINNIYLKKIKEEELLSVLIRMHGKKSVTSNSIFNFTGDVSGNLKYLNLSSMIWLNRNMIESFFEQLLVKNTCFEHQDRIIDDEDDLSDDEEEVDFCCHEYKQDLIVDLTDSGMYKNLAWAKCIDLNTLYGCKLASKIIRNELLAPFDEFMRRERIRRGRIGENYLA